MTNIHTISKHLEILARDCSVMELPYLIAAVDKVLKDIKQLNDGVESKLKEAPQAGSGRSYERF